MNEDTISRQAAIDALCEDLCGGHEGCKFYPCDNLHPIQKLPSAERRGRWIHKHEVYVYCGRPFYPKVCSVCNGVFEYETTYCPNCGARMEVE